MDRTGLVCVKGRGSLIHKRCYFSLCRRGAERWNTLVRVINERAMLKTWRMMKMVPKDSPRLPCGSDVTQSWGWYKHQSRCHGEGGELENNKKNKKTKHHTAHGAPLVENATGI